MTVRRAGAVNSCVEMPVLGGVCGVHAVREVSEDIDLTF